MMGQPEIGRFHVLTDFHFQQRHSHADLARLAVQGGADTIQFRQKTGGIRHILKEANTTVALCQDLRVPILVNDRVDIALACGADGVHLGQMDFPVADARRILGEDTTIGATATTLDQALRAQDDGADYIGFGPVFETGSKPNPASVKGLSRLETVASRVGIPVIAIAGVTAKRVERVMETGAHGVAVMTAVTTASDPAAAAREIRNALDRFVPASTLSNGQERRNDAGG